MPAFNVKKDRLKKLEAIKKAGVNPYPIKVKRTHTIEQSLAGFDRLAIGKEKLSLTGRIRSFRLHGGSSFIHLEDGTGQIQAYFKKDRLGKKYKLFLDGFDVGDFIEVSGSLFKTKRGEKTLEVSGFKVLAKALLPLPEKWHGLKDVEERFRKRYLDLIMNKEVKERFLLRSKILGELRAILGRHGFLEVETPILQLIPGGALAKPFKTHLNALNLDLYLRVAPELYLKRLLVGGFEKIYEIARCFRNEGIGKHHNPDFTMLELYWAYQDKDGLMKFTEKIFKDLVEKTKGRLKISFDGNSIDFSSSFKKANFRDLIKKHCSLDIEKAGMKDLQKKLKELGVSAPKTNLKFELWDELFKKVCRPKIIQPTFVVFHPVEMAILAKASANPKYADRFQLVVGGIELINGFSELNDPKEQEKRFKEAKIETERKDKDFLEALMYGMPPSAGLGMGLDRLALFLTDSHSLREIILFPIMRPK